MVVSWESQLAPEATLPATYVLILLKISLDRLDKKDPSEPIPRSPTTLTPPAHHPHTTTLRRPHTINQHPFRPTAPLRLRPAAAEPKKYSGSGIGPEQALEAIKPTPSRTARKLHPFQSFPASAGLVPRSQKNTAERDRAGASIGSDQTHPLAHSAKAPSFPEFPCERRPGPAEPGTKDPPKSPLPLNSETQKLPDSQTPQVSRNPLNVDKPRPAESPDEPPAAQAPDPDNR